MGNLKVRHRRSKLYSRFPTKAMPSPLIVGLPYAGTAQSALQRSLYSKEADVPAKETWRSSVVPETLSKVLESHHL